MKLSFTAIFSNRQFRQIENEEQLNDIFLMFLPRKLEITPVMEKKNYLRQGQRYMVKMETSQLYTMEDIREKLRKMDILMTKISSIKREFTETELEEIKKLVCFEEIFNPKETVKK